MFLPPTFDLSLRIRRHVIGLSFIVLAEKEEDAFQTLWVRHSCYTIDIYIYRMELLNNKSLPSLIVSFLTFDLRTCPCLALSYSISYSSIEEKRS